MAKPNVDCNFAIFVFCIATKFLSVVVCADCFVVKLYKLIVDNAVQCSDCMGHSIDSVVGHTAVGCLASHFKSCFAHNAKHGFLFHCGCNAFHFGKTLAYLCCCLCQCSHTAQACGWESKFAHVRHCIDDYTTVKFFKFNLAVWFGTAWKENIVDCALCKNHREVWVGCDTIGYVFSHFKIVLHTLWACFLVATKDDTDALVKLNTFIHKCLHCKHRNDDWAFVIDCASAPNFVIHKCTWIGRMFPTIPFGHYVKVTDDAKDFFPFANFGISTVSIKIDCAKTKAFGNWQNIFKTVLVALTKRTTGNCICKDSFDLHWLLNCFNNLWQIFFYHIALQ